MSGSRLARIGIGVVFAVVLPLSGLEGGIISGSGVSGPLTFGTVTPGSYGFADFGGPFQASLVTVTVTGTSTGVIQLNSNGTSDYTIGDRILLSLTNNSSATWTGIGMVLTATAYDLEDHIDPSRGTFASNNYTSNVNQRLNSADVTINSPTNTQVNFTFDTPLAPGATTYFYLPVLEGGEGPPLFSLQITPAVSSAPTTPVPPSIVLTLAGIACVSLYLGYRGFGVPGQRRA